MHIFRIRYIKFKQLSQYIRACARGNCAIGGFVAGSSFSDDLYALFRNCNVVGDISVNNTTGGTAYAGGIIGYEYPYPPYLYIEDCSVEIDISLKNRNQKIGVAAGIVSYYSWGNLEIYVYNCNSKGSINAQSASAINGGTPWASCNVDYKNNSCDIYLNGEKKTAVDDYYLYKE